MNGADDELIEKEADVPTPMLVTVPGLAKRLERLRAEYPELTPEAIARVLRLPVPQGDAEADSQRRP